MIKQFNLLLLIGLFTVNISAQLIDDSIVELIETGVKVGNLDGCGDAGFSPEELLEASHEINYAEAELRALLEKAKLCAERSQLAKVDAKKQCREEREAVNKHFFALKKHDKKRKLSLGCSTKNDNSPLFYLTKNNKHRGTDEGSTASHNCFLEYPTQNGKVIMRLENSLFTEFVDFWLGDEDLDLDGVPDTELGQRALERTKLQILYEWVEKPGLKIAIGPYIAKQVRGEAFGTRLQNNWHKKNGVSQYHELTPEEERTKKYGGGVTVEVTKTLLDKQKPFYELRSEAFSKTDLGYEAGDWLVDQKLGANLMGRTYSSRFNQGAYLGGGVELELDHTTLGKDSDTALWQRFKLETGYESKNFEFSVYGAHAYNAFYGNRYYNDDGKRTDLFLNDDGQDNITTKNKGQFEFGFRAIANIGNGNSDDRRNKVIKNDIEIEMNAIELEILEIERSEDPDLFKIEIKKQKLEKLGTKLKGL